VGGTGLEPVTPSLSIWRERSRPIGWMRSAAMVRCFPGRRCEPARTRTNSRPCHSCHAPTPRRLFRLGLRSGSLEHRARRALRGRRSPRLVELRAVRAREEPDVAHRREILRWLRDDREVFACTVWCPRLDDVVDDKLCRAIRAGARPLCRSGRWYSAREGAQACERDCRLPFQVFLLGRRSAGMIPHPSSRDKRGGLRLGRAGRHELRHGSPRRRPTPSRDAKSPAGAGL
jgi:hypothetical protein